jgi:YegS/Rv2252/BmrU family lipid kinase
VDPQNPAERRRALFVVNPALQRTGRDFGRRLLELAGELGWEAMLLETAAGLNVEAIGAALARRNFDLVLAAGGDGTVAEVMAAAHQRGLPMGIVPLGTANIVARELGLPAGWRKATRRALERFPATRAVDLARVNDGYMALAAGIGFDATVMRHTPPVLKYWFGRAAYFLAGAWWLPRAPLFECTIRADGEETRLTAVVVLVVNAGMLGAAPFRFGPDIAIDDGWLDICIYRPRTARERAGVLWHIARQQADGVSMLLRKARSVEIKAPDVQWHEVDGEVYRGNVLRAEVVPGGVKVVT